jgi:hypothetical protein
MTNPIVLILCTGNSAWSQMAEGLLRAKAGDVFEVISAGTEPAPRVNPLAIDAMREIGIDISSARPKDPGTRSRASPDHRLSRRRRPLSKRLAWGGIACPLAHRRPGGVSRKPNCLLGEIPGGA